METEAGTLFAGHRDGGIEGVGGGLLRSDDDGQTWTVLRRTSVQALAPLADGGLLVSAGRWGTVSLFRASADGETWTALGKAPANNLFRAPDGVVFSFGDGAGVRRSTDGGATWIPVNDGLSNLSVTSMLADDRGFLIVGTVNGLFRSERPVVAAEAPPDGPAARLEAPRPNPVTSRAVFALSLDADADVDLGLYDVLGRRVATLASGRLGAGRHEAAWERGGLASGVYLAILQAGGAVRTQRVTVVP